MRYHSTRWGLCAVGAKFICDLTKEGLLPSDGEVKYADAPRFVFDGFDGCIVNDHIYNIGNHDFPMSIKDEDYVKALKVLDVIYNTENIYASPEQKERFLRHQKE